MFGPGTGFGVGLVLAVTRFFVAVSEVVVVAPEVLKSGITVVLE